MADDPQVRSQVAGRALVGEQDVFALVLTHPAVTEPICVVADTTNDTENYLSEYTIEGKRFLCVSFDAEPPQSRKGEISQAKLRIDNIGRAAMEWVEKSNGGRGATVRVMRIIRPSGRPGAAREPDKPTYFSINPADGGVTISASAADGGSSITRWDYRYRDTGGAWGSWTAIGGSALRVLLDRSVSGLSNGTSYGFQVRAVNVLSPGTASNEMTVTPNAASAAPSGFTVTAGDAGVLLKGSAQRGSAVSKWQYRRKTTGDYGDWVDVPASAGASVSVSVGGLANGTAYTFQMRTVAGSIIGASSAEVLATPRTAPNKPSAVTVAPGNARATFAATATDGGSSITKWRYRYGTAYDVFGSWIDIPSSAAGSITGKTVTGLPNGTLYFQFLAVNAAGDGTISDIVQATLKA